MAVVAGGPSDDGPEDALGRASILLELGRPDAALPLLSVAAASEPTWHVPRCMMAQAHLQGGRPREAFRVAEAAAGLQPQDDWPHRLRSAALLGLGRPKKARAAAEEAVRLAPGLADAHATLGEAQLACCAWAAAQATARRLLELEPNGLDGHNLLGRVALSQSRFGTAEDHFRDALRIDAGNAVVLNNLALALRWQGRRDESVHLFAQSSAANPHDGTARANAVSAAGDGGAAIAVGLVVQFLIRPVTRSWPPLVAVALGALTVLGTAAYLGVLRRRRRGHDYPKASPELLRTLRRQAFSREWFRRGSVRQPPGMFVVGAILAFGLAAVSGSALLFASFPSTRVTYETVLLLVAGLGAGALFLVAALRRRL